MFRRLVYIAVGLTLAGCAAAPLPFTPEFYRSPRTTSISTPLAPVAVYQFTDKRPVSDPTVLGEHPLRTGTYGKTLLRATEPVGTGTARAFAEALRARGVQVIDRTLNPLSGELEGEPGSRAISGEVLAFSSTSRRTGLVSYAGGAAFHVRVHVHGREPAGVRWEKDYLSTSDSFLINSQLVFLSQSLVESVENTVNDPAFIEALR
jgi:hypothetical protein